MEIFSSRVSAVEQTVFYPRRQTPPDGTHSDKRQLTLSTNPSSPPNRCLLYRFRALFPLDRNGKKIIQKNPPGVRVARDVFKFSDSHVIYLAVLYVRRRNHRRFGRYQKQKEFLRWHHVG